jgi:signal transduction histidine kinase
MSDKSSFLNLVISGLVHEIRNPLNSMYMNTQLLEEEIESLNIDDFNKKELLDIINTNKKEIKRLNNILSESLKFAKPVEIKFKRKDINLLIDEVLKFVGTDFGRIGISINRRYVDNPIYAMIDENEFKQVLLNIFLNAKESMKNGGILSIKTEIIDNKALITVSDTGIGIKKDDIDKVFTPFFSTKKGGIGIGLPIAKRIIEAHSGDIKIESEEGKGTKIEIRFPLEE